MAKTTDKPKTPNKANRSKTAIKTTSASPKSKKAQTTKTTKTMRAQTPTKGLPAYPHLAKTVSQRDLAELRVQTQALLGL